MSLKLLLALAAGGDPIAAHDAAGQMPAPAAVRHDALDRIGEERRYRWHVAIAGESVQLGVPGTDDRALRVDCRSGRIAIAAPTSSNAGEGTETTAAFAGGETRRAEIIHLGDGPNVVVELDPADRIVGGLLAGDRIVITTPDDHISVSTEGAAELIRPLVEGCR
jgi:hypothetical protein